MNTKYYFWFGIVCLIIPVASLNVNFVDSNVVINDINLHTIYVIICSVIVAFLGTMLIFAGIIVGTIEKYIKK